MPTGELATAQSGSKGASFGPAEKAAATTGADYWTTRALPQVGLRSIRFADGPHGLRVQNDDNPDHLGLGRSEKSTCFPPAVTLAASWDPDLVRQIGAALGREARSKSVDVVLGPGINIKRSPLCGRNFEYYSEDPLLAGRLAGAMIEGLQSERVGACLKHFAANNQETDRYLISADIDERPLREIYLRPFEIAIREANPWTVMSSYNQINGVATSQHRWLLTRVLREEWGYDGLVVSDWGGVYDPVAAVRAGNDVRMPGRPDDERVRTAARIGDIDEAVLDTTIARLHLLAARTDAEKGAPVDLDAHHQLTRRAAAQSAVLLHNDAKLLPLDPASLSSIAVIGEMARSPRFQGAGSSLVNPTRVVPALDALQRRIGSHTVLRFAAGYPLQPATEPNQLIDEAVAVASDADVVLLFLGLPPSYESEGSDRTTIDLPDDQIALLEALAPMKSRIAVVLCNGSAVTTAAWRGRVGGIVEFWLTGQAHGDSIVDVLTGEVDPAGRLAETIPVRLEDTPAFLDFPGDVGHVRYAEGIHVGYRWYDARKLDVDYPFGHGLSYTTFDYSDLQVEVGDIENPVAFTATLTLTNTGTRHGSEVVQLYVTDRSGFLQMPEKELRAFAKVTLEAGQSRKIALSVRRSDLEHFHLRAGWTFPGGELDILIGSSSRDIRLRHSAHVTGHQVSTSLTIWSPYRDWLDHPIAGPAITAVIERNGGVTGRKADQLSDPVARKSTLSNPVAVLCMFPGFPVSDAEAQAILDRL